MTKSAIRSRLAWPIAALLLVAGVSAGAAEPAVTRVIAACKVELQLFCDKVTPGNGRLLACLYANEDQLSVTCDYHLLSTAGELRDLMDELSRVGAACKADIQKLCIGVETGKGRVARCLRIHQAKVSTGCLDAIDATGIDVK